MNIGGLSDSSRPPVLLIPRGTGLFGIAQQKKQRTLIADRDNAVSWPGIQTQQFPALIRTWVCQALQTGAPELDPRWKGVGWKNLSIGYQETGPRLSISPCGRRDPEADEPAEVTGFDGRALAIAEMSNGLIYSRESILGPQPLRLKV
jgi:hypothetical protein